MLETITTCPICSSTQFREWLQCTDHLVTQEQFAVQQCQQCQFLLTNPRPDPNSIINYYKSDSYVSHSNKSNSPVNFIYRLVRAHTLKQKLSLLNRYALHGNLLDYGCGTGHFIKHAQSRNWAVKGIEPDSEARQIAGGLVGLENVYQSLDGFTQNSFQAITLFHVLEHVHDLVDTLSLLVNLSTQQGVILIAVPNFRSHDALKYQSDWAAYDLPRHLYHFDSKSMLNLANKVGLKIVAQLPMHFDSYYVSLLSEKYRKSSIYPLRGFYSGFISNLKARRTKEYSSLIYVLQKK